MGSSKGNAGKARAITHFSDINQSHEATNYAYRTDIPSFHVFTLESTYPDTVRVMPPYTKGFYQITLIDNSRDVMINMDSNTFKDNNSALFFQAPNQVLSWVRGEAQFGYIIYFQSDFIRLSEENIAEEFPFFRFGEVNYFPLEGLDADNLFLYFKQLLNMFESSHTLRTDMLRTLLMPLLYECKSLLSSHISHAPVPTKKQKLIAAFECEINQHFIEKKMVEQYADLLHVTASYLNEVVKSGTGTTALGLINKRVLGEAKNLISYTTMDIAEIAFILGYEEPSHFGRFFKKETGSTPLAFRKQQQNEIKPG